MKLSLSSRQQTGYTCFIIPFPSMPLKSARKTKTSHKHNLSKNSLSSAKWLLIRNCEKRAQDAHTTSKFFELSRVVTKPLGDMFDITQTCAETASQNWGFIFKPTKTFNTQLLMRSLKKHEISHFVYHSQKLNNSNGSHKQTETDSAACQNPTKPMPSHKNKKKRRNYPRSSTFFQPRKKLKISITSDEMCCFECFEIFYPVQPTQHPQKPQVDEICYPNPRCPTEIAVSSISNTNSRNRLRPRNMTYCIHKKSVPRKRIRYEKTPKKKETYCQTTKRRTQPRRPDATANIFGQNSNKSEHSQAGNQEFDPIPRLKFQEEILKPEFRKSTTTVNISSRRQLNWGTKTCQQETVKIDVAKSPTRSPSLTPLPEHKSKKKKKTLDDHHGTQRKMNLTKKKEKTLRSRNRTHAKPAYLRLYF